jgi:hypothetical protein
MKQIPDTVLDGPVTGINLVQGLLRPALWSAERRARAKGHEGGERTGDIWRLPGVFLVEGARVMWSHEFRHAGDHPEWDRIPALVAANRFGSG